MEARNAPLCWLDGKYLPLNEAAIPPDDLGLQRGYGIFDFLRVMGRVPLYMEDHMDRFYRSAERMYLTVPVGRDELRGIILHLAEVNGLTVSGMRSAGVYVLQIEMDNGETQQLRIIKN